MLCTTTSTQNGQAALDMCVHVWFLWKQINKIVRVWVDTLWKAQSSSVLEQANDTKTSIHIAFEHSVTQIELQCSDNNLVRDS